MESLGGSRQRCLNLGGREGQVVRSLEVEREK